MTQETNQLRTAMALQIAGRLSQAEKIYREILVSNPQSWDALHLLGLVRAESNDEATGVKLIESAIKLNGDVAAFHHNLAGLCRRLGRLDEAEGHFRRAIQLKPDYAEAFQGLAEIVNFKQDDPLLAAIEDQLNVADLTDSVGASYLHFAAGKILDDTGNYSAAFEHYKKGNAAAGRSFSVKEFRQGVKDNLYCFSAEFIARYQLSGSTSNQPIFVVGMPRSGTSLIEQILASHSRVHGAGELNDMKLTAHEAMLLTRSKMPYPHYVPRLTKHNLQALSHLYLSQTRHAEFQHVVDKHPLNFLYIGLIFMLFPNAKIIHTERHPLDTCLSCFFQHFTSGQDYSFDLDNLGEFYLDYQRLMSHWHTLYPGKILDLRYEDVLADQKASTMRLLDYCELPFEEACLNYYETKRTVKTASFKQVRQPIYQTSRGRWQNYTTELQGLAKKLGLPTNATQSPVTISKFR